MQDNSVLLATITHTNKVEVLSNRARWSTSRITYYNTSDST